MILSRMTWALSIYFVTVVVDLFSINYLYIDIIGVFFKFSLVFAKLRF